MHAIICVFDFVHFTFWAYGVGRLLMDIGWQSVPYQHEECGRGAHLPFFGREPDCE